MTIDSGSVDRIPVGVLGATGMVGQRIVSLLASHPWFEIVIVAASPSSAGKTYGEAMMDRWSLSTEIPRSIAPLVVKRVEEDAAAICTKVKLVFCAVDMSKEQVCALECLYAELGVGVVSNNSAHRMSPDVPVLIPEVNPEHTQIIENQRRQRGWKSGFIAVKPNCSIQSYVPVLAALADLKITDVEVTTLQAVSGAGKKLSEWPEMEDNVIPFISGEEEKSEREPLKIFGHITDQGIELASSPTISATCIRVPVSDGHLVSLSFDVQKAVESSEIIKSIQTFVPRCASYSLPSVPPQFLVYLEDENRPQTKLDRDLGKGMTVSVGRLRQRAKKGWKCVALSHNTLRGAAGGAVLMAELLHAQGYIHTN